MTTLRKEVYKLRNTYRLISDDSGVSDRLLAGYIHEMRAKLMKELLNKDGSLPQVFVQHICLQFERTSAVECCDLDIDSDCYFMKSTKPIPHTLEGIGNSGILSIKALDGSQDYSFIDYRRVNTSKYNKFTGNRVKVFRKSDYLYLMNTNEIQYLTVGAIFTNPEDASLFSCGSSGNVCFNWDSNYPITEDMAKTVVDMVLKERLGIMYKIPEDVNNDTKDNPEGIRS